MCCGIVSCIYLTPTADKILDPREKCAVAVAYVVSCIYLTPTADKILDPREKCV